MNGVAGPAVGPAASRAASEATAGTLTRWRVDLGLGIRLAVGGGREGWARTVLTGVGIGLGVALLLFAASVPHILDGRWARGEARSDISLDGSSAEKSNRSMLVGEARTIFHGEPVYGRLIRPDGPDAPVPPGVATLPGVGEMVVSPALARVLGSRDGVLLRERLPYRIVGRIGDAGLLGPGEYAYYARSGTLDETMPGVHRIDHYGDPQHRTGLDPVLTLIAVVGCCVLLFPVVVFVAVAVRFGGENRDRRLAALRLVGADRRMTGRVVAGEALVGALLGLLCGVLLFLTGRVAIEQVTLANISVFARDVRPSSFLVLLIGAMVPLCALVVSMVAMRSVVVEPLGVVRRSAPVRRRLWWRLIPLLGGAAALVPLIGSAGPTTARFNPTQVVAGVLLLLLGLAALLPWLVEAVARRAVAGPVAWQLAIRRLQVDSGTAARAVSGITVTVAGVLALQMLLHAATVAYSEPTQVNRAQTQVIVDQQFPIGADGDTVLAKQSALAHQLGAIDGVRAVGSAGFGWLRQTSDTTASSGSAPDDGAGGMRQTEVVVASCGTLHLFIHMEGCVEGDAFLVADPTGSTSWLPRAGERVEIVTTDRQPATIWTVPAAARAATPTAGPDGTTVAGVFVTPSAVAGAVPELLWSQCYLRMDTGRPDVVERIRNVAAATDPMISVQELVESTTSPQLVKLRTALTAGMVAVMILVGASLLVGMVEQLRHRRRPLAVLAVFGVRRATMSLSLLWQNTIPILLGLTLAVPTGIGLGTLVLFMIKVPLRLDWRMVGVAGAASFAVVGLVTAASMPLLWRLMRPVGLRSE